MPRRALPVLLAACIPLSGAAATAQAGVAIDEMRACARLGPKPPGSSAGRAQADRIAERFRAAGLATTFEDFHMPVYVVKRTSIEVVGPGARSVPGETFAFGGTVRVESEVVDVGVGRAVDYVGKDVKGKIVMVRRDEAFHRSSQLTEVVGHGGAAMLYVSGSPENLRQTGTVRFAQAMPATIPTVTVGAGDGGALRADLQDGGLRMAIDVDADRQDAVARNVIGVRRGAGRPDDVIVVGAHYDNWHAGAVDNCSAVGTLLSMVDAVRHVPHDYTVVFAAWDAEEIGLTGSYDWVMRHPDVVRRVVVNQNLEMTAANAGATAIRFGTSSPAMNLAVVVAGAANNYNPVVAPAVAVRNISGGIIPTDLQPFYSAGVQGFSTFTSTPYYHTVRDVPELVDELSLERVSAYARDALLRLQDVPSEALRLREVPHVTVTAPADARAGAAVPVEVRVTTPAGAPMSRVPVRVLVNQDDHWPVAEGMATAAGSGVYRYTIPAGATDADRTSVTATVNRTEDISEGYASVDQTSGSLLGPRRRCASRRVIRVSVRPPRGAGRIRTLRARSTAGRVRVVRNRQVVLDLRRVGRRTVRLRITVRTTRRGTLRQSRTFRTCVTRRSLRNAVGGG